MDRRVELENHLTHLDAALERSEPREVAALLRERRVTLRELAEVPKTNGRSIRDELTTRREARRAAAQTAEAPARRRNKRSG